MLKFTLSYLLICCTVFFYEVQAQEIIQACCNDTVCAPGTPVQLTAVVDSSFYGDLLSIEDDTYSQLIELGFNFTFFGKEGLFCF